MLFSSNLFLFLFLPLVILLYYLLPRVLRNVFLLVASLIFYAWGTGEFVFMMIFSILFNYAIALIMEKTKHSRFRRVPLVISVAGNLGILFVYKYLDFAIVNLNRLGFSIPLQHIALPLGISFFTFQAMSYSLDVYLGKARVQKNPLNIGLYVSFFPQLVAGPIVRYQTIADQIDTRQETLEDFCYGVKRFIIGFAKKIILSNNMALVADAVFADPERSVLWAWMGALAYTYQILFDFSGYSDMAIGLGRMFGFHFLENFDYPYIAKSVSEFWRRWHMSLGQWFRDYVYFPLGGSRVKSTARLIFNIFIVWFLTGLWHGANWNYIAWGLMYFVLLTFEKLSGWPRCFAKNWQIRLYQVFTFLCTVVGMMVFRSESMGAALNFLMSMFGMTGNAILDQAVIRDFIQYRFYFLASILCATPVFKIAKERICAKSVRLGIAVDYLSTVGYLFALMWAVSFLMIGSHNPFIYFNF